MSWPRPEGPSQSDSWRPLTVVVSPEWLETGLMADMVAEVTRRERMLFDELAGGATTPVVLFGAGHLGRRTLAGLRHVGVQPLAFVDNNAALQGCEIDGLAVHAPADAATRFAHAAFVVTVWSPVRALAFAPVSRQLKELGAERVVSFVPLFWKYADEFCHTIVLIFRTRSTRPLMRIVRPSDSCETMPPGPSSSFSSADFFLRWIPWIYLAAWRVATSLPT